MKLKINKNELIDLKDFEYNWRWATTHNPLITDIEKAQIEPMSEEESMRINNVIEFFEIEDNLRNDFLETDWITANCDDDENIDAFRTVLAAELNAKDEKVIVTWNRSTSLRTTKELFVKYWDDFCYPSSDDVTIISEDTNWVMFYRHYEVVKIWTKKAPNDSK